MFKINGKQLTYTGKSELIDEYVVFYWEDEDGNTFQERHYLSDDAYWFDENRDEVDVEY